MKANKSFHNACIINDCLAIAGTEIDNFIDNSSERYETDDCGNIIKIDGLTVIGGDMVYALQDQS